MAKWQINSSPSPFMPKDAFGYALALKSTYCLATIEPVFAWRSDTVDAWKATAANGAEMTRATFDTLSAARTWCEKEAPLDCHYDGEIVGAEIFIA